MAGNKWLMNINIKIHSLSPQGRILGLLRKFSRNTFHNGSWLWQLKKKTPGALMEAHLSVYSLTFSAVMRWRKFILRVVPWNGTYCWRFLARSVEDNSSHFSTFSGIRVWCLGWESDRDPTFSFQYITTTLLFQLQI